MKHVIGILMLVSMLIGIFVFFAINSSIAIALTTFALAFAVTGCIWVAVTLIAS